MKYNFECDYRVNNNSPTVCKYQSLRLGHLVGVSHLFCNHVCPKHIYDEGSEDIDFIKKCFHRRYDSVFLDKVLKKHKTKTNIIVPDIWNGIYNIFNNLLCDNDWFIDIGITGSIIVDGVFNHKDIDIVIEINNIDKYIEWVNNNTLPKHINHIPIDYFIYIESQNQFFTSLWPNKKAVYMNSYFESNITIPLDYTIRYNKGIDSNIYDIK